MFLTIQTKPLSKYLYMVLFRFGTDFAKWNFGSNVLELLLIVTLETLNSVKPILKPACDQVVFGTMKKNKFKAACVRNHIFCLLCFFFCFPPFWVRFVFKFKFGVPLSDDRAKKRISPALVRPLSEINCRDYFKQLL